eukprot:955589-Pelagomonas_calceolata.AAC.7
MISYGTITVSMVRFEKKNQERAYPVTQGSCPALDKYLVALKDPYKGYKELAYSPRIWLIGC